MTQRAMTQPAGVYLDQHPPYVRGTYGRAYDVTGGTKAVRKYLDQLRQMGMRPDCGDYDLLLDALLVLTARERMANDDGTRHDLRDVAAELGVDLDEEAS